MQLDEWYAVEFDAEEVRLSASPPNMTAWQQSFRWDEVVRVCFQSQDFLLSDELYIFTSQRPESYLIPLEASGAAELWGEIIHRGLFDARLAIQAAQSHDELFCWPPIRPEELESKPS